MFNCILSNRNYCSYYQYLYYYNSISINSTYKNNKVYKKRLNNIKKILSRLKISIGLSNKKSDVTIVITSCIRVDLLMQSIRSLIKFNTYPINELIIIEDSEVKRYYEINHKAIEKTQNNYYVIIIKNSLNIKQNRSIDRVYKQLNTKYVFHSEDDWRYYRFSFIEKSKFLFEIYYHCSLNKKILQLWLRNYQEMMNMAFFHWYTKKIQLKNYKYNKVFSNSKWWKGFSFNPGLKKNGDYIRNNEYKKFGELNNHFESEIGIYYKRYNYEILSIGNGGYIDHLGWGRHVSNLNRMYSYNLICEKKRRKIYNGNYKYKNLKVPFVTHRIWIFDKRKTFINESIVKIILYSIKSVSQNLNVLWQHFFWTNFPELLARLISDSSYLSLLNYIIITSPHFLIKYNLGVLCNRTKYVSYLKMCKKVLPNIILERYGGIYINTRCKINFYLIDLHYLFNFFVPIDKNQRIYIDILGSIKKHIYHKYFQQHIIKLILSENKKNTSLKLNNIDIFYNQTFFLKNRLEFYIPYENMLDFFKERCLIIIKNENFLFKTCSVGKIILLKYKLIKKVKHNLKSLFFIKEYIKYYYRSKTYNIQKVSWHFDERVYNIIVSSIRKIFFPKNLLLQHFKTRNYFAHIEQEEKNSIRINLLYKMSIEDNYIEHNIICEEHEYLFKKKLNDMSINIITTCNNYSLIKLSLLRKGFIFENINLIEINVNESVQILLNNYIYEIVYYIMDLNEVNLLTKSLSLDIFEKKIFIRVEEMNNLRKLNDINEYWERIKILKNQNLNEYFLNDKSTNYNILRLNNLELECDLLKTKNSIFNKSLVLSMHYNDLYGYYIEKNLKLYNCLSFVKDEEYSIYTLSNYEIKSNTLEIPHEIEIMAINERSEISFLNEI